MSTSPIPRTFAFDFVADSNISQQVFFENTGLQLAEQCISGYNACVFAYGQTSSGKTYTMYGHGYDQTRGLIPRCIAHIITGAKFEECLFKCSFLEIYQEKIIDLLSDSTDSLCLR